jgi:N-carbamoylputrescine amidase
MEKSPGRTLRIAAIQMVSKVGAIEENLAHARELLEQAVKEGAQLVIFPELMPSGYTLAARIWEGAEPSQGPTAAWLREAAAQFGVYVGTSFIEAQDGHFYNTFVLAAPDGHEAGRVHKEHVETYFFKGKKGTRHVIETEIGKIGVGICGDNHYASLLPALQREQVDLMLMPHAWPAPKEVTQMISEEDIQRQTRLAKKIASLYHRNLGVPVVYVNRVGPAAVDKGPGLTSRFMNSPHFKFAGLSTIIDSNGELKIQLSDQEGAAIADVLLDPGLKTAPTPPAYGNWVFPGPITRDIIFGLDGIAGKIWYTFNTERKRISRRVEAGSVTG